MGRVGRGVFVFGPVNVALMAIVAASSLGVWGAYSSMIAGAFTQVLLLYIVIEIGLTALELMSERTMLMLLTITTGTAGGALLLYPILHLLGVIDGSLATSIVAVLIGLPVFILSAVLFLAVYWWEEN